MECGTFVKRFRVETPICFRLADYEPSETAGLEKDAAKR